MKKMLMLLAAFIILSAVCSQQVKEEVKDEIYDAAEDISEIVPGDDAKAPKLSESGEEAGLITEEQAKEIALNQAGLTSEEVVFELVKLEKDDGIWEYEVDFKKGKIEYDAEISATDGTIISWEVDND